jgi:multidrug efflux pump
MQKRFTDIFIKRPVFATCLSLIILIVGLMSFTQMDVRLFPKIDAPLLSITTTYAGASSEIMEGFVATPIENAISTLDNIDYITSTNELGSSVITVYMQLGADIDTSMTDVANKVASVRGQLPQNIDDPIIAKASTGIPLLLLQVKTTKLSSMDLTDFLARVVQPQMQMVDGVSEVDIWGARSYAMRIWLDPHLMAAHQITAPNVYNAISNYNVISAAGTLNSDLQQLSLYSSTDLNTADQFSNILLQNKNGQLVQIKDIGLAEIAPDNTDFSVYADDVETILLNVQQKSDANPLTIVKNMNKLLVNIRQHLPSGVTIEDFFDSTLFIKASIHDVQVTIIEACIFVFLVIFLMLGSFRSVLVPLVTIPLSLTGACIIMVALNFSINILTLLAFVLAIGLVVDDAIVVLENVHRHLELGLTPKQAALIGAREISFAIIAMTLTLAAVYAPIGFMGGLIGKLFTEFAFTLAGSVIISGFIALTLSPMMCSKIFRENENFHTGFTGFVDRNFDKLRNGYKKLLGIVIKFRWGVVIFALIVYTSCYFLFKGLQNELAPEEDQGVIMVQGFGPATANLEYTEQQTPQIATAFKKLIPERQNYGIVNGGSGGVNSVIAVLRLKEWDLRKRTAMEIRDTLLFPIWSIPGMKAFPFLPPMLPGATGYTPVAFVISTTSEYDDLEKNTEKFIRAIQEWGGVTNVQSDLKIDQPQQNINVDYNKANDLGISNQDIGLTLSTFLAKQRINYFNLNGRSYEVLTRLYRNYRDIPDALNNLNLQTKTGELVPLSNISTLTEEIIPESRNHFQQLRAATVTANLMPGVSLGTALTKLDQIATQVLPKEFQVDYAGQSRQYIQSTGSTGILFTFAIIFIFLILAAQFESFRDPFIVLLTVPLAFTGALAGLYLCHGTMNIYTQIGLVTLVGLITKNGILIVEFANQQQERGVPFYDAIVEGAAQRLRPILMTTLAMILGAIPLAMATGACAVSRQQMGFVIVFGLAFGTLLTLFVVPTAYFMFATKIKPKPPEELEEEGGV